MKLLLSLLTFFTASVAIAAPSSFDAAKAELRQYVYHDQQLGSSGTAYCGCNWKWTGRSGGRIDPQGCGLRTRIDEKRALRLEWEHVMPAHSFGQQRTCWREGGRQRCGETDPVFAAMEADMHNLVPAEGEVNSDRSNFRFGMLPTSAHLHGACATKIDFRQRTVELRDLVKGEFARKIFYMTDRYDLHLSEQQQQLLMVWDKQYPVSNGERELERRIASRMGHHNPFVTGARTWSLHHRNSREGLLTPIPKNHPALRPAPQAQKYPMREVASNPKQEGVRGNRNSKVYHMPVGCPSYAEVSERNVVHFADEAAAQTAGFRKAANCRQ